MVRKGRLALLIVVLGVLVFAWLSIRASKERRADAPSGSARGEGAPALARRGDDGNLLERTGEDPGARESEGVRFLPVAREAGVGALEVAVVDEDAKPVGDARVAVWVPVRETPPSPRATATTGIASFEGLPAANGYGVTVVGKDGMRLVRDATVVAGRTTRVDAVLPRPTIEGVVLDATTKAPVANAIVEALDTESLAYGADDWYRRLVDALSFGAPEAPPIATTSTDGSGRFSISAATLASASLVARAPDGRRGIDDADARARGPLARGITILVAMPSAITGIVVDEDGAPVVGARVRVGSMLDAMRDASVAVTDSGGQFRAERFGRANSVSIVVEPRGAPPLSFRFIVKDATPLRIVVPSKTWVEVRVVDDATSAPLAGADVSLMVTRDPPTERSVERRQATGADGVVRIAVPAGTIQRVIVSAQGFRWGGAGEGSTVGRPIVFEDPSVLETPLAPGETRSITVRMRRGCVVTGRIAFPDGSPVFGARVEADDGVGPSGRTARSDRDGRFRLEGVLEATVGLHSFAQRMTATLDDFGTGTVDLARGWSERPVFDVGSITLQASPIVRGRVVDESGRPIAGASVERETTDEAGRFELRDAQDGPHSLTVSADGYRELQVAVRAWPLPGEVRDLPPIALYRARSVRVRVLDERERPISGVELRRDEPPTVGVTDADGFVDAGTVEGDLLFRLRTREGARYRQATSVPVGDVIEIHLAPATRVVEGRVVDETGSAVMAATVIVSTRGSAARRRDPRVFAQEDVEAATTDANGRFRVVGVVGPGVHVRARSKGHVTAGVSFDDATQPVEVVLRRLGDLERERLREIAREIAALFVEIRAAQDEEAAEGPRERIRELETEAMRLRGE